MSRKTHGGTRDGAGRPTGTGRFDPSEPLGRVSIPVVDKAAVIDFARKRQLHRLSVKMTPQQLAALHPGRILLPAADAPPASVSLYATGVRAGFPSPADDYLDDTLDLNAYMIEDGPSTFMVRVEGDSMTGAHIFEGDVLIVDKGRTPVHGDIVVAAVGGDFTVKRLEKIGGRFILKAENPAYPPIVPTYEQELVIWGVVTGSVRKF